MFDIGSKKGLFTFGLNSYNRMTTIIKGLDFLPQKPTYMLKLLKMVYSVDTSNDQIVTKITNDKELLALIAEIPAVKNNQTSLDSEDLKNIFEDLGKNFLQSFLEVDFAKKFHKSLSQRMVLNNSSKWKQSLKAAVISRAVAQWVNYENPELAFMGALLLNLPTMLLEFSEPQLQALVDEKVSNGTGIKEAELAVYGFDHTEFGVRLMKHLGLPYELQDLVLTESSINPKSRFVQLTRIVSFAKFIAKCFADKTQSPSSIWLQSQTAIKDLGLEVSPEQWGNKISLLFVKSVEFEMSVYT